MKSFIVKDDGSNQFREFLKHFLTYLGKKEEVQIGYFKFYGIINNELCVTDSVHFFPFLVTPHEAIEILTIERMDKAARNVGNYEPPTFERGERILVRDDENEKWVERVLIAHIPNADMPFITVCAGQDEENRFFSGGNFLITMFRYGKKLLPKVPLTIPQIAAKFGIELEQVEIKI